MLTSLIVCLSVDLASSAHDSWRTIDSFSDSPGNFFIRSSQSSERRSFDSFDDNPGNFQSRNPVLADEGAEQSGDIPQTEEKQALTVSNIVVVYIYKGNSLDLDFLPENLQSQIVRKI